MYRLEWTVKWLAVLLVTITLCGCARKMTTPKNVIMDHLSNAAQYSDLHSGFEQAFEYLTANDMKAMQPGEYAIDGDRIFCIVSQGEARSHEEADLEFHRKYIDIQYVIEGTDIMGWKPMDQCRKVLHPYDPAKDIGFCEDRPVLWQEVRAGDFIIFFPDDAHAPFVGQGEIKKAVIKVAR